MKKELDKMTRQELLENLKNITQKKYIYILRTLADKYDPDSATTEPATCNDSELLMLSEMFYELNNDENSDEHPFIEKYILDNSFIENHGNYEFYSDEGYDTPENDQYIRNMLISITENFDNVTSPTTADIESISDTLHNSLEHSIAEEVKDNKVWGFID